MMAEDLIVLGGVLCGLAGTAGMLWMLLKGPAR